ncbi:MAG: hypothetical protein JKY52_07720 [Flavobacteriales bacterium]|nr:hypothetical protein [Flavobacteriales bacterium]
MRSHLFVLICLLAANDLRADLGASAIYEGIFKFKNGYTISGLIEVSGYRFSAYVNEQGKGDYTNDDSLLSVVKSIAYPSSARTYLKGEFTVYEHIFTPAHFRNPRYNSDRYGVIKPASTHILNIDSLASVKFIRAFQNRRAWLTSELIVAPKWLIEKLEKEKYQNWAYYSYADDAMEGHYALSYNPEISNDSLLKILTANRDLLWPRLYIMNVLNQDVAHEVTSHEEYKIQYRKYLKAHTAFRYKLSRMHIIIVRVWSTC